MDGKIGILQLNTLGVTWYVQLYTVEVTWYVQLYTVGVTWCVQLYTDQLIPWSKGIVCTINLSHPATWADTCQFERICHHFGQTHASFGKNSVFCILTQPRAIVYHLFSGLTIAVYVIL